MGATCTVVRNDEIAVSEASKYDGVLISPGPGTPERAGVSVAMVHYCAENRVPLFGVCLGHQAICVAFGGRVSQAPELLHGKTSLVHHTGTGVLLDVPNPFTATRYHSLALEKSTLPEELEITSETDSGVVMSVRHTSLPIEGVQFHPESVLTEHGHKILANWLVECGDKNARGLAVGLSPIVGK